LHTLTPRLSEGLQIAADVLRNANFPDAEVHRLREERRASLRQERDEPTALAARALAEAIYGNAHPYGTAPRGTRASVATLDRNALATFHNVRYHPSAVFTVSAGEIGAQQMAAELQDALGDWTGDATGHEPIPFVAPPDGVIIHLVDKPGAPQSEIRIGCAGPHRATPDYARLVVLNTILGGAFTSRLNLKLREEKGFTYGARSHFTFRRGPGPFVAGAAVATANTAEAVQDALREITRLGEELVPEDELDRARNYLALGLPRRMETASAMAAQLADLHLHGLDPSELVMFAKRVRDVTGEDILKTAGTWLNPSAMSVVVVGDAATVRGPLEALNLGPVQPRVVET
jgi:predicted Zn-dependent peptidase